MKAKIDSGEKTFSLLTSTIDTLRAMGVEVQFGEKECIEEHLTGGWIISAKRKRTSMLAIDDLKFMIPEDEAE